MSDIRYKVNLTEAEVNTVLTGLGQLPFVQVYELINAVKDQVQGQMKTLEANSIPDTSGK